MSNLYCRNLGKVVPICACAGHQVRAVLAVCGHRAGRWQLNWLLLESHPMLSEAAEKGLLSPVWSAGSHLT